MCGIVGYLGPQSPKEVIVQGLKKLEYRGYDSAGVSILNNGHLKRVRAEGKLIQLEQKLKNEDFNGSVGIGHTRWATHGVPSELNAHPHQVGGVSIVHNGIIENYVELKNSLLKRGAKIDSDTDTEVVAHLISEAVLETHDIFRAVLQTLPKLKGAFSILVLWEGQPHQLVAFKDGPPLIIGHGKGEAFVVSDVQAALGQTDQFVYLSDREIAVLNNEKGIQTIQYFSETGVALNRKPISVNVSTELAEKKGYSHFMLKEIYEQPQAVASVLSSYIDLKNQTVNSDWLKDEMKSLENVEQLTIIACGSSYYAGLYAQYVIEKICRIPVSVDIASEYRYRNPVFSPKQAVLTISQSGETADTLAALRLANSSRTPTVSLCNVKGSTIDREAKVHLYMQSGPEIGVASTKAFTSTLATVLCFALRLAAERKLLSIAEQSELIKEIIKLPSQMEIVLNYDSYFSEAASELKKYRGFLYMGRGVNYPIALEGALKLKELAYLHAEGYAAGEMKHGPLALIDKEMAVIMIAPRDELYEKTVSNLEEVRARGGKIISISTGENVHLTKISERYLSLPEAHTLVNPLLVAIPLQLMAFHLANSLGYDVDQPRNLAKSVTVE